MMAWGGNFAVVKLTVTEIPPMAFLALRFAVVAVLLAPFCKVPRDKMIPIFFYAVTMGGVHFGMMFTAMQYVDAATAALLTQIGVPFATLVAVLAFKDFPGWRRWSGILIAFAGAAVIGGEPRFEGGWFWIGAILVAAMAWGLGTIQVKAMGDVNGWSLNAWMSIFSVPMLAFWSWIFEANQIPALIEAGWLTVGATAYQSLVVAIFGYGAWFWLLKRYPVSLVMPFSLLGPMFGVASGVFILGDALTPNLIFGGALTLFGVGVIVVRQASAAAEPAAVQPVADRPPERGHESGP